MLRRSGAWLGEKDFIASGSLVVLWAGSLAWWNAAFTPRRSPVQVRPGPPIRFRTFIGSYVHPRARDERLRALTGATGKIDEAKEDLKKMETSIREIIVEILDIAKTGEGD